MQVPFCPFRDGHDASANPSMSHCSAIFADSARHAVAAPPPLIPLNFLPSSIVRVSSRAVKEDATAERVVVYRASVWTAEEKARCIDNAQSWIRGVSSNLDGSSTPRHETDDGVCISPIRVVVEEEEKQFPLDDAFVEGIVTGSLWKERGSGVGGENERRHTAPNGDVMPMDRIRAGVHGLCRLLQQHHDKNNPESGTHIASRRSPRGNKPRDEKGEEEARRILAHMRKVTGESSPMQAVGYDSNGESLLVGLVCHEQLLHHQGEGEHNTGSGGVSIRPLLASDFIRSCDGHDGLSQGDGGAGGSGTSSISVMLLLVEFTEESVSGALSVSPFWRAIMSVVDFVYVDGRPLAVSSLASLLDKVCHATTEGVCMQSEVRHFIPGCAARPAVCPLFFYTVTRGEKEEEEEQPMVVEHCRGRVHCVQSLQGLLCVLMELTVEDPLGGAEPSSCRDVLQWTLLLEHAWHAVSGASSNVSISPIGSRMNAAITTAVDMFVATAEGVLMAMRAMEPLPPLLVCDRGSGVKAVPRHFSVDDAMQTAYRVGLLAYEAAVAPCVFDGRLTPRSALLEGEYCSCRYHASRHELYAACKVATDALNERLRRFTVHCAKQALKQAEVTPLLGLNSCDDFMTRNIHDCIYGSSQFLEAPLISHCGVVDTESAEATRGPGRHGNGYRMVESPIVLPWAPLAKAIALSDHVLQSLLPALLDLSRQQESACNAAKTKESEVRGAMHLMEDHCLQLQMRWKETEARLEHQQSTMREARRQHDILSAQLQEAYKCLQRLVMTCVGYEETHDSYARKLSFRLKHGCSTNSATHPHASYEELALRGDDDASATPQKLPPLSPPSPSSFSAPSSLSGQAQLMQTMLRDAQLQLEACHNVVRCLYEDAREALRNLSTSTTGSASVSLNNSRQSMLSVSLRAARGAVLTGHQEHSVNVSISDSRSDRIPAAACPATPTQFAVHDAGDELGMATFAATARSPTRAYGGSTHAVHNLITATSKAQREKQQYQYHQQPSEGVNHHLRQSSHVWRPTSAGPLLSPDRGSGSAAVDAIADLQRQRQEAVDAVTELQRRYLDLEGQLAEERATLLEVQRKYEVEQQEWNTERQVLQERLNAIVKENCLAHERCLLKQQEAERWALSWTEMMVTAQAEARRVVATNSIMRHDDDDDDDDDDGRSKYDVRQLSVSDPQEALRAGRVHLRSLILRVEEEACLRGAIRAERIAEERDTAARHLLEQEVASLRDAAVLLQLELDCAREQIREKEEALQKQVSVATTGVQTLDEVGHMIVEANSLREAHAYLSRRLFHAEAVYASSFEVWGDAMLKRCAFILHQWWMTSSSLLSANYGLYGELQQSQREARGWEEAAQRRAEVMQKTAVELMQMAKQVEKEREARDAANAHVAHIYYCLNQLLALYVESHEVWWRTMTQRCELLLQQWYTLPPAHEAESSAEVPSAVFMQPIIKSHDPCALRYELQLKKRHIAELEEALRQRKLACATLAETVVHLNALLQAQRDLGMPSPPPPLPVPMPDLGFLSSTPTRVADAVSLATSMFASPFRVGENIMGDGHDHTLLGGAGTPHVGGRRLVALDDTYDGDGSGSAAAGSLRCSVSPGGAPSSSHPRSVGWYLQSLSAIKSTLEC